MLHEIYSKNNGELNEENTKRLKADVFGMFQVTIETVSHTVEYGVYMFAKYPQYQTLIYDELVSVYVTQKNFRLAKMNECIVLRAFINETLRCSVVAPRSIPHQTTEEIEIEISDDNILNPKFRKYKNKKYIIPKSSQIDINMPFIFESETIPFDLENWIKFDSKENRYQWCNNDKIYVFPFGVGKRSCPGEHLARKKLFYALAKLIWNFTFAIPFNKRNSFHVNNIYSINSEIQPKYGIEIKRRLEN